MYVHTIRRCVCTLLNMYVAQEQKYTLANTLILVAHSPFCSQQSQHFLGLLSALESVVVDKRLQMQQRDDDEYVVAHAAV